MSLQEAIQNQETARVKGFDKDGDGVVSDAEYEEATAEPETPDMSGINTEGMTAEQKALLQQYPRYVRSRYSQFSVEHDDRRFWRYF